MNVSGTEKAMTIKHKPPTFVGELGKPIVLHGLEYAKTHADQVARDMAFREFKSAADVFRKRMAMLLAHYEIEATGMTSHATPDNPYYALSLSLAIDFVPGLMIFKHPKHAPKVRGAPRRWKGSLGVALYNDVSKIERECGKGVAHAIRTAKKRHPERWGRYSGAALEARYYEVLKLARHDGLLPDEMVLAWMADQGLCDPK
jgi:hypothetical protein